MTKQDIRESVAARFGIQADEEGRYDMTDYDWQSGCYINGVWLCLAVVVELIEDIAWSLIKED